MPDVIQQIQHGVLNIIAQVENIGFVAQGIVQSNSISIIIWVTQPQSPTVLFTILL
jgi:hypothetical protein